MSFSSCSPLLCYVCKNGTVRVSGAPSLSELNCFPVVKGGVWMRTMSLFICPIPFIPQRARRGSLLFYFLFTYGYSSYIRSCFATEAQLQMRRHFFYGEHEERAIKGHKLERISKIITQSGLRYDKWNYKAAFFCQLTFSQCWHHKGVWKICTRN